ncbi:cytochrome P450 [Arthrobacter sp. JSM 101049]|uniref:cytochrome P450 n=1 Tax=Arthrobacter sp. JSM 101049 TaxID=929097 RepID=UPI003561D5A5
MIPTLRSPDQSFAFLREGYSFIGARCDRLGTDAFYGRLLGRRTLFLRGPLGVELLYAPGAFPRAGGLPASAVALLQDRGSVQRLEGQAHRHRKDLLVRLGSADQAERLADVFERYFAAALARWKQSDGIRLHDELVVLLGLAAQEWAGLPTHPDAERRARDLGAMIEQAGSVGPANWLARIRRAGTERWSRRVVRDLRNGQDDGTPVGAIAHHRDESGQLLDEATAAVEVLNLLRPIVAVARFIDFAAVELDRDPAWQERFRAGDDTAVHHFAQEIRRTTPFFPAIAGVADREFTWDGTTVPAGTRTVADLYGTDMDPRLWPAPRHFDPRRFPGQNGVANHLVPQGGGDVHTSHRCPGEDLTLALLERSIVLLSRANVHLPAQDLSVNMRRMPALPASRVVARFPSPGPGPSSTSLEGHRVGPDFIPGARPSRPAGPHPKH